MNESKMDHSIDLDETVSDINYTRKSKSGWQKKSRCFMCDCRFNLKVKRHHW